ncbi:MAG: hypothetical protein PHO48_03145 [Candidatus Gracilibacteria bacterium]|nr:hypothetical protein [Candidatus Gracilibacteria bacterium]MDD5179306.1 hypothetical protein [Candidatus Gracilibacteria bacterium]
MERDRADCDCETSNTYAGSEEVREKLNLPPKVRILHLSLPKTDLDLLDFLKSNGYPNRNPEENSRMFGIKPNRLPPTLFSISINKNPTGRYTLQETYHIYEEHGLIRKMLKDQEDSDGYIVPGIIESNFERGKDGSWQLVVEPNLLEKFFASKFGKPIKEAMQWRKAV